MNLNMHDDIIIIDNFVPKILQNQLENEALDPKIDYYFYRDPAYFNNDELSNKFRKNDVNIVDKKEWVFMHDVYQPSAKSKFYNNFQCVFKQIQKELYSNADLMRFRLVLSPPSSHNQNKYGPPHCDFRTPDIKAAVYYVSDSEGDTIIFEEKYDNLGFNFNKKTVYRKVTPKKGRIVIFDANRYHSNSWPLTKERVIFNINFKV